MTWQETLEVEPPKLVVRRTGIPKYACVKASLVARFREVVRVGPIIATDDTTVTLTIKDSPLPKDLNNPKNARACEVIAVTQAELRGSITARMWVYRSVTQPINVFDFTVSRHRDGPEVFLDGFAGSLMADCYSGYEAVRLRSEGKLVRATCVAHARRKVFNAQDNHPLHARELLAMFRALYDIEGQATTCAAEERPTLRTSEARPIWERMRGYLACDAVANVMPKETFGQAITYLRNQFEHLLVYLDDGRMPTDNTETEQLMKQVALGRKNWMFIGSVAAGYRAADLMSLVSSAARSDLDVFLYVKHVLDRLLAGDTEYEALRPHVWKHCHPEAVRLYKVEERQARADAQAVKQARRRLTKSR